MLKFISKSALMIIGIIFVGQSIPVIIQNIMVLKEYHWDSITISTVEISFIVSFVSTILSFWTGFRSIISSKLGRPVLGLATTALITMLLSIGYFVIGIFGPIFTHTQTRLYLFGFVTSLQFFLVASVFMLKKANNKQENKQNESKKELQ